MFGFGKKKKMDAFDLVIIKAEEGKSRQFYLVSFPTMVANDIMSMFKKLEKSAFNKPEYLGEVGGFRIITHVEGYSDIRVIDEVEPEGTPIDIQDFSNILLRRLEALDESGKFDGSEDLAFIMGELTMLRDGSFVKQDM